MSMYHFAKVVPASSAAECWAEKDFYGGTVTEKERSRRIKAVLNLAGSPLPISVRRAAQHGLACRPPGEIVKEENTYISMC